MSPREFSIINYRDGDTGIPFMDDQKFMAGINKLEGDYGSRISIGKFGSEGEYGPVQDWKADPAWKSLADAAG